MKNATHALIAVIVCLSCGGGAASTPLQGFPDPPGPSDALGSSWHERDWTLFPGGEQSIHLSGQTVIVDVTCDLAGAVTVEGVSREGPTIFSESGVTSFRKRVQLFEGGDEIRLVVRNDSDRSGGLPVELRVYFLPDSEQVAEFEEQCELGKGLYCGFAADKYRRGEGVAADPTHAVDLAEKGCSVGHTPSCSSIAQAYLEGKGRPEDKDKAREMFEVLCAADAVYCSWLGSIWEHGNGVKPNRELAVKYYALACMVAEGYGDGMACWLAGMLIKDTDPEESEVFRQRACDVGFSDACVPY